ncbi:MAG: aminopeptidase [Clostridia bacterium BRH_c25]|nr:MAG: aminopeptidase [Clostridia bacterium BRH_c25]
MVKQKRIEDYGIRIGELPKGRLNKITDVEGVRVGHCTIDTEESKTGVTVIIPSEENIFTNKLVAGSYVLNGFGKSLGLVQVDELGSMESVIALTNTLNVGLVHDAVVEYLIKEGKKDNVEIESVNPLVFECNDSYLNDIQLRAVKKEHVFEAIEAAAVDFDEGDTGAGKGMSCHHLKGGIGSASRVVSLDGQAFTVGVLVLSNHGRLKDLSINGKNIGSEISKALEAENHEDKGSIISIIATDVPLDSRQLGRICRRAGVGLARLGSYIGHGSGEIMFAFSTANVLENRSGKEIIDIRILKEDKLDEVFRAVAECEEEAVLNSMVASEQVVGIRGRKRESLKDFITHLL